MRTITISLLGLTLTTGCQSDQELLDSKATIEPDLSLTTPAAGAWIDAGLTSVEGQSQDMQKIELDGVAAELHEDGSYTARVAPALRVRLASTRVKCTARPRPRMPVPTYGTSRLRFSTTASVDHSPPVASMR